MTDLTVRVSAPGARESTSELNATAEAADRLGDEAKETGQQVERMGRQADGAGNRARRMSRGVRTATVNVGRLNDRTKSAGGLVGSLASGLSGLGAVSGETGGKLGALAGIVGAGGVFGIAAAGAAGIVGLLVENFQEAGQEAEQLSQKLEGLFQERAKLVQQGLADINVERQARSLGIDPTELDDLRRQFNFTAQEALNFRRALDQARELDSGGVFIDAAIAARRGGFDPLAAGQSAARLQREGGRNVLGRQSDPVTQALIEQTGSRRVAERLQRDTGFVTASEIAQEVVMNNTLRANEAARGGLGDPQVLREIASSARSLESIETDIRKLTDQARAANNRSYLDKGLSGARFTNGQ